MNSEGTTENDATNPPGHPLWVTSQFSTKELVGQLVSIQWLSNKQVVNSGIYQIHMGNYGHSRHIQAIHITRVEGDECEPADFDFDQADADSLHRTNESPKSFSFTARLERDRKREQNPLLARLVQERQARKLQDEEGGAAWEIVSDPVLMPSTTSEGSWTLPEELERENA
jgi:hypothetical protein